MAASDLVLPDVEDIRLTDIVVSHGATQVPFPVFDVCLAVKYLNEVIVTVIGHLEVVFGELEVDMLPLLCPDDPCAVHRHIVRPGVVEVFGGDVGTSCNHHTLTGWL